MDDLDTRLEKVLEYAFSPQFGYLTVCPTNVGTGMRVSVMLHLPALVMTRQIDKVFQAVQKISLAVRGLYGEGTQASGDFYQISNQGTLGKTERDITPEHRTSDPQDHRVRADRAGRPSQGQARGDRGQGLEGLRLCSDRPDDQFEETMDLLSAVRMGVNLKIIRDVEISTVNELFIFTQPAHLQKMGAPSSTARKDVMRATSSATASAGRTPAETATAGRSGRVSASAQSARTAPGNPAAKC